MLMEINFFLNMAFNTTNHPYHLGWTFLNYLSSFVIENYPCKVQWIRGHAKQGYNKHTGDHSFCLW